MNHQIKLDITTCETKYILQELNIIWKKLQNIIILTIINEDNYNFFYYYDRWLYQDVPSLLTNNIKDVNIKNKISNIGHKVDLAIEFKKLVDFDQVENDFKYIINYYYKNNISYQFINFCQSIIRKNYIYQINNNLQSNFKHFF